MRDEICLVDYFETRELKGKSHMSSQSSLSKSGMSCDHLDRSFSRDGREVIIKLSIYS